ncbi:hypothetical protein, partial [Bacteroides salyersiae]
KKHIILTIVIISCFSPLSAQKYYHMLTKDPLVGIEDWISNLLTSDDKNTGIGFTTGLKCRGFVTADGCWGLMKASSTNPVSQFSDYLLHTLDTPTLGVQGHACIERLIVGNYTYNTEPRNTIDLEVENGYGKVTTKADKGLILTSEKARKIYLYGNAYFDQYAWCALGPGRNNDPTINNDNNRLLRIGSTGGVAIWGNRKVASDDKPQFSVKGSEVYSYVPLSIQPDDKVRIFLGTSNGDPNDGWIGTINDNGLHIGTHNMSSMYIGTDQNIYLGLNHTEMSQIRAELKSKYKLFVGKGILSEDYSIAPKSSWSDFVFQKDYQLRSLTDLEKFIKDKKHLPDIPSAKKIAEDGYSQHEMNKVLLQKVEELTLYVIELQKQVETLKAKDK